MSSAGTPGARRGDGLRSDAAALPRGVLPTGGLIGMAQISLSRQLPSQLSAGDRGVVLHQRTERSDKWLPICLALVAGYVDTYALLAYGVYVSFMSGNTTQTGSLLGRHKLFAALHSAVAILLFVVGSFSGTWLTNSTLRQSRQLLLAVVAAILALIVGGTQFGILAAHAALYIATLALARVYRVRGEHNDSALFSA